MNVIIQDKEKNPKYSIKPVAGNVCYQLFEWKKNKKGVITEQQMGIYPTRLNQAVLMVAEHMTRQLAKETQIERVAQDVKTLFDSLVFRFEDEKEKKTNGK
jgi:hypothetical protein